MTSVGTTYRPWRTRPTKPNRYPQKPERPEDRPQRPHKPHKHHTTSTSTTTTTTTTATTTTTTTTTTSVTTATTSVRTPYTQRPRYRGTSSPPPKNDKPDKCDTSYDAISIIRREIFVFKGRVSCPIEIPNVSSIRNDFQECFHSLEIQSRERNIGITPLLKEI